MVQRLRPKSVNIINRDGECSLQITLDININLNQNGISASVSPSLKEDEDNVTWEIPDFESSDTKIKFGKDIEE